VFLESRSPASLVNKPKLSSPELMSVAKGKSLEAEQLEAALQGDLDGIIPNQDVNTNSASLQEVDEQIEQYEA